MLRDVRTLYSRLSAIADAIVVVVILLCFFVITHNRFSLTLEEQLFVFWALLSWGVITATTRFYYHTRQGVSRYKVVVLVVKVVFLLALSMFLYPVSSKLSLREILILFVYIVVAIALTHFFVASVLTFTLKKMKIMPRMLILGDGENGTYVKNYLSTTMRDSCKIVGVLNESGKGSQVLGTWYEYAEVLSRTPVDEVIFALPHQDHHFLQEVQMFCADRGVRFHWIPLVSRYSALELELEYFGTLPVLMLHETPLNLFYALVRKRLFDVFVAFVVLILSLPLFVLVSLLVKLTSRGPLFSSTTYFGVFGVPFVAYSFRTTRMHPYISQEHYQQELTSIGGFLHSTRLDLLPYLFLVLQGKLSIVGPRPEEWGAESETKVFQVKRYSDLLLKPGLIGRTQVHAWRMRMVTPESKMHREEHDMVYCKQWSLSRDMQLLWRCLWRKVVCVHLFRHRFWKLPL